MINKLKTKQINILGYSGSYLALLFETITANNFKGVVNIVRNEKFKRAVALFETGLDYNEVFYYNINPPPDNNFVFCSNKPVTKKFLFDFYVEKWNIERANFLLLKHPSAVIASSVKKAYGLYMEPLAVIAPYSQIGFGVTVNRNSSVGHHNQIGDYTSLHPGVNLCGHVEIGKSVTIGAGATVFDNIKIGDNSIIGGGSVVTKNIPENVLAYGNPCKIIKEIQL